MTLNEDVEALRKVSLFANLEPARLKLLAFTSERIIFDQGDDLCIQGDQGDSAYIIINGEADVIVNTGEGELTVAQLGSNDIVGEIAILCDVPRTATVRAAAETVALKITKDSFFHLVTQFPQVGLEVMNELASRLQQTTRKVTELTQELRSVQTA